MSQETERTARLNRGIFKGKELDGEAASWCKILADEQNLSLPHMRGVIENAFMGLLLVGRKLQLPVSFEKFAELYPPEIDRKIANDRVSNIMGDVKRKIKSSGTVIHNVVAKVDYFRGATPHYVLITKEEKPVSLALERLNESDLALSEHPEWIEAHKKATELVRNSYPSPKNQVSDRIQDKQMSA